MIHHSQNHLETETHPLFRPLFLKAIRAVPAAAPATIAPGNEIKFGKYPVFIFFIKVQSFNQVSAAARKGVLLFLSNKLVEFLQATRTEAVVKRIGQKGPGFVAQYHFRTGTG